MGKIADRLRLGVFADGVAQRVTRRAVRGEPGGTTTTSLARGDGWWVDDVHCTLGPADRPFEERHSSVAIALVLGGTFQCRSDRGKSTLTPGSLMLGNEGQCFTCGHEHAAGDRCVAFRYSADYFESVAADFGVHRPETPFRIVALPPTREISRISADVAAALIGGRDAPWDYFAIRVASVALHISSGQGARLPEPHRGAEARITEIIRAIERDPAARLSLSELASQACLSPFHFLRTFARVTGVTPHQFILRTRLREAATLLVSGSARIIDVAFATGFGDLSNFTRAFRHEFGMSPKRYRQKRGPSVRRGRESSARDLALTLSKLESAADERRNDADLSRASHLNCRNPMLHDCMKDWTG